MRKAFQRLACFFGFHALKERTIIEATEQVPAPRVTHLTCERCPFDFEIPVGWHVAEADGPASETLHRCTEAAALAWLRARAPTANVIYTDRQEGMIFYRVPKRAS